MIALATLLSVVTGPFLPDPARVQDPPQQGSPQQGELVAEFLVGGQRQTLSRTEVAEYLARRHRNSPIGRETVDHLIEVILVRRAAQAEGLMPNGSEIRADVRRIESALKRSGRDLDAVLAKSRLSRSEFEAKTALGIAQRRLAARILKLPPEQVTAEHLALWTREQRNKTAIVTDPRQLGPGVLAKVGDDAEVTALDVGLVIFTKVSASRFKDAVHGLIFERIIAHEGKAHGIELSTDELVRQYQKKKQAFEANATNQGVEYEKWLEALGSSKEQEIHSPATRTNLIHGKLVRQHYPPQVLDAELEKNRAELMRRHGARRALSVLFIRATDKPNKLLGRDFAAALTHIQEIRATITQKKRSFALMAKISSDDPTTKQQGGDIGWQHRDYLPGSPHRRGPEEVLAAAFEVEIGTVTEPIRTGQGYYLAWVSGLEPEPDRATLHARLLGEMAERYNLELFEAAKIHLLVE